MPDIPDGFSAALTLLVAIVFVMPGFVWQGIFSLLVPRRLAWKPLLLLEFVAESSLVHGIFSPLTYLVVAHWAWPTAHPVWFAFYCVVLLLLAPALLGVASAWFITSGRLTAFLAKFGRSTFHPIPEAWDRMFFEKMRRAALVRVTFEDGTMVAGLYGLESTASSSPIRRDLYLERVCRLKPDGNFDALIDGSRGIWIRCDQVRHVEFLDLEWHN